MNAIVKFYSQILLTALLFLTGVSAADTDELYRWSDANGNPVISDRPPPAGISYTSIDSSYSGRRSRMNDRSASAPAVTGSPTQPLVPPSSIEASYSSEPSVEKNPNICLLAQDNIFKLETFARIRMENAATGEVRFLSDEERQSQLDSAHEQSTRHCD